jgi:hypothetical protein
MSLRRPTSMLYTTIKILHTAFVCLLVPIYWYQYGPQNFLWFSDLALILSVVALWRESSLLASALALSVLVFDIIWCIDIVGGLPLGKPLVGFSPYMFDPQYPLWLRLLSLFHLWMPPLLIWMVARYGYDRRALVIQTLVCWIVLLLSYFISTREENINYVFGLGGPQQTMPPAAFLVLLMIAMPLMFYVPTHLILLRWALKEPAAIDSNRFQNQPT